IEIPVLNFFSGLFANEIEYKVRMQKDATIAYSWEASDIALPDDLYWELHGHTVENEQEMTVVSYAENSITHASGTLTAAFDGVHGWYFLNSSDKDTVIRLRL